MRIARLPLLPLLLAALTADVFTQAPASSPSASTPLDQRPDAALKGLNRLGVGLVGVGADAAKCGLKPEE